MPTFTTRGFPLYNGAPGGDVMPAWDVSYNAHSTALETALDDSEAAIYARDWVETIAELPITGNQPGRLIWVEEDDRIRRWDGAQWGVVGFPPSISTTPTPGSGWQTPFLNSIYQRSGWVQLTFNAYRSTAGASGAVVVDVPVGYRGNHNAFAMSPVYDISENVVGSTLCYYDTATEQVKVKGSMADDTSIAFNMSWALEGAT